MAKTGYKQTLKWYAERYECSVKTIQRHQAQKHPLDDPDKMEAIFAAQKNRPTSKSPGLEVESAKLTNEQLENPSNDAEAKLYERILICRKLAHQNNEARRLVIPLDEVKAGEMRVCAAVKSRLLSLPGEMPGLLVGKAEHEIQKALFGWVHETLTNWSNARSSSYA